MKLCSQRRAKKKDERVKKASVIYGTPSKPTICELLESQKEKGAEACLKK